MPGFNPLTASQAELDAHDFPPRPHLPKALHAWETYAREYVAGRVILCTGPFHGPAMTGFPG
jgi:hypothetical protein